MQARGCKRFQIGL